MGDSMKQRSGAWAALRHFIVAVPAKGGHLERSSNLFYDSVSASMALPRMRNHKEDEKNKYQYLLHLMTDTPNLNQEDSTNLCIFKDVVNIFVDVHNLVFLRQPHRNIILSEPFISTDRSAIPCN
ncbi:hypothetical protein R1flu_012697 [Riccia fluitans]|uniref:Uncharacterized protein n=1 Tax=Riccia fluitans TaxID=41844 RepID=A0ABD1ZCD1_9MARC